MKSDLLVLAPCLFLGACADPPKAAPPSPPAIASSPWAQLQEASTLESRARQLLSSHATGDALRVAYRALEIRRRLLGDGHLATWTTAELVADIHLHAGQIDQADTALQFDLAARERTLGLASADLAGPLGRLADLAVKRRNYALAEQLRRRALSVLEGGLGPWHPDVASESVRLATLLLDLCRGGEAEPLARRALEIQERVRGPNSPDLADAWQRVAQARWIAGDDASAESSLQKAIALLSGHESERGIALMKALIRLATDYDERQLPAEARAAAERAVDIGARFSGQSTAAVVMAAPFLWDLYQRTGGPEAAEKLLPRLAILRIERSRPGATPPTQAPTNKRRCVPPATPNAGTTASPLLNGNAAAVVSGMQAGFRQCYNKSLQVDPNARGAMAIKARIDAMGEVVHVSAFVTASLVKQGAECVVDRVMAARFAQPEGGGATLVIPVTFVSQ